MADGVGAAPPVAKLTVGAKIPHVTFKGIRHVLRCLDNLPKSPALVMVHVNATCPIVPKHYPHFGPLGIEN